MASQHNRRAHRAWVVLRFDARRRVAAVELVDSEKPVARIVNRALRLMGNADSGRAAGKPMQKRWFVAVSAAALVLGSGLAVGCDSFPDNPSATLSDSQLAVVYQICGDERVERISLGSAAETPLELWSGTVASGHERDGLWVVGSDVFAASAGDYSGAVASDSFVVEVWTTSGHHSTQISRTRLREGQVRDDGRYRSVNDFLSRPEGCTK